MRTHIFILVVASLGLITTSHAQEVAESSSDTGVVLAKLDFYQLGMKAYEDNDYITALKYLFAYRVQHEAELQKSPDTLLKLNEAITYCETQLRRPFVRIREINVGAADGARLKSFFTRMELIQKMLELQQEEIQSLAIGELGKQKDDPS